MITSISVDGFKTLVRFQLDLHPGLNILVGPNGSGKTNIISFFEFLAHLIDSDASEATSRMGGAGAVFRKVQDTYQAKLTATVTGCYELDSTSSPRNRTNSKRSPKISYALYQYSFTLLFSSDLESVVFTKQQLRYKLVNRYINASELGIETTDWGIEIETTLNLDQELKTKSKVTGTDEMLDAFFPFRSDSKVIEKIRKQAENFVETITSANTSLLSSVIRFNRRLFALLEDLTAG